MDGGTVFAYKEDALNTRYLATVDPKYVKYKPIVFRFIDKNGNERAVLEDNVYSTREVYLDLKDITVSKTVSIPSDRMRCGGKIQIYSAKGADGKSGDYSSSSFQVVQVEKAEQVVKGYQLPQILR